MNEKPKKGFPDLESQKKLRRIFRRVAVIYVGFLFILALLPGVASGQGKQITGKVTDKNGLVLPGVSVAVKGTSVGMVTDLDGKFQMSVPQNAQILVFSFVGMKAQEVPLENRTTFNIQMEEEAIGMDEVVVVGYGTQKKANLTGAVDQVTSEAFENRSMTNVTQGLKGVMPNLNIRLLDGKPTEAPSYNIRGTTSIGSGGSALVLIDGVEGDPRLLNPNDIASVSILKDAASASIYGARGAFGVVLITTRNPDKEKTSITVSSNYSIKQPVTVPDFVTDGYTWAKYFAESFVNWEGTYPQAVNKSLKFSQAYFNELERRHNSPLETDKEVEIDPVTGEYVYYASTDHYKYLYKDYETSNEQNISISGSSKTTSYLLTGRYLGQDGLFRYNTDKYQMMNFRGKGSVEVFPWLRIDNNSEYSDMKYHNPSNVGEGSGIWRNIGDEGHPLAPIWNPDGTLTMSSAYNIGDLWYGKNGYDFNRRIFKNTSGFVAQFFKNTLRFKGDFTFQNTDNNEKRRQVQVPYSNKPGVIAYVGTATNDLRETNRETQYIATNLYSEYETTFRENHYLKFLIGYNFEQSTYRRIMAQRNGLIFEDATDLNLALGQSITTEGGWERWNILGGFSRLNYVYKDKYLLEVNGRYDGSSKFPSDQRFAFFPSYSAGWRISKESFWHLDPKWISNLKVRASYGSLGNGNIGSYVFMENFNITQSGRILNGVRPQYTSMPGVLPDNLTWETATTSNFGLDLSMFNDRLDFVGDYYIRKTTEMFTIGMTVPAVFGASAPRGNYADMETKGWEIMVTWRDRFNLATKPFNYDFRFTLADSKSVIQRFNNPDKFLTDYYVGQVIGEIWGYETEGFFVDQADIDNHAKQSPRFLTTSSGKIYPGDIKLKDRNGDGEITPGTNTVLNPQDSTKNPGDRFIIGNSSPRFTFSFNIGANWNNFFLTAFFQGVGKQNWWPSTEAEVFWGQYNRPYNKLPSWHLDNHWTPENTDAYLPRYVSRQNNRTGGILTFAQTKYLQNIAYIRLRNIQFGYNLPKGISSKIGAENVKVYFSGESLWTWSPLYKITKDIDVDNTGPSDQLFNSGGNSGDGYNYPMLKTMTLGLSVTF
jgi:TonB-linked SusC/RagA family outer membrane protein